MLKDRIAIVTGASAGIGLAIAQDLVALGARVIINARRAELLVEIASQLNASAKAPADKPVVVPVAGDCAEPGLIEQLLNTARRSFGAEADLVVVNAGRGLNGSVLTSDPSQWDEMLRTNVLGAALLIRAAGKRMLTQVPDDQTGAAGAWVNKPRDMIVIGSVVGRHVSPFSSMYGGTKFAVHGMVEGVRRELGPKGIRVTLVEPGFVVSEFQQVAGYDPKWFAGVADKIGPALEPADVARAVSFIAQQPARVHVSDVMIRPTRQDYP
jgi:NADP-dependent 3-hydroxy acid dehydrogenase YdfG